MKERNKESNLTVISLKDIDPNFKTIESLFDPNDLNNLKISKKEGKFVKDFSLSSTIKTFIKDYEISENTISNFKKLFDYILNL